MTSLVPRQRRRLAKCQYIGGLDQLNSIINLEAGPGGQEGWQVIGGPGASRLNFDRYEYLNYKEIKQASLRCPLPIPDSHLLPARIHGVTVAR